MEIYLSKKAQKDIRKAPKHVLVALDRWVVFVKTFGILLAQEEGAFKDKPLQGKLFGYRSIRLNHQWRAIYHPSSRELVELVRVTPHDYTL